MPYENITNPYTEMEKYPREKLDAMSLDELLAVQRSVLYPNEQKLFDKGEGIVLPDGDGRVEFLDYTDHLIASKKGKKKTDASEIDAEQYAKDIVEAWDMDTLIEFAVEQMTQNIKATPSEQLVTEYNEFHDLA